MGDKESTMDELAEDSAEEKEWIMVELTVTTTEVETEGVGELAEYIQEDVVT